MSPNETRSYSYDNVGRRTAWSDASGATTVAFDDAGRMTGITTPAGVVSYGYNAAGEQTSMTQPEGTVTTSYDVNGFVAGVSDWRGDSIAMSNDADGRMLNAERSNGVDTNYWYDDAGRLTGVDHANAAGPIDGFQYMLDGNGNRTMVASNAGSESYTLDALNRVTAASYPGGLTEAFAYDAAGNRTSHTKTDGTTVGYTVDATGQLISDTTGTTYTYDAAGNLTSTSDGDSYSYDDYGRTIAVTSDGVTASFGYDAANVRVSVDGEGQLWDRNGGLPTLISTATGDNYVHTAGVARDGDDWLLADAVGSVRATVDDTGATVGSQAFTVFGEQLAGTGSFGFAGEQLDPTGQLHLRARQYNPGLGRFTSVDPVQPGAPATTGYNLYAYSGNNPTTWTDPSGQVALVGEAGVQRSVSQPGAVALSESAITAEAASGIAALEAYLAAQAVGTATAGGLGAAKIFGVFAFVLGGGLILGGDTPIPEPEPLVVAPPVVFEPVQRAAQPAAGGDGNVPPRRTIAGGCTAEPPAELFRSLRPDEDPAQGLFPKNPTGQYTLTGHIQSGSRIVNGTQYISTTASESIARVKFGGNAGRVVRIDSSQIQGNVYDFNDDACREEFLTNDRAKNIARADQEVIIEGSVPPSAVTLLS